MNFNIVRQILANCYIRKNIEEHAAIPCIALITAAPDWILLDEIALSVRRERFTSPIAHKKKHITSSSANNRWNCMSQSKNKNSNFAKRISCIGLHNAESLVAQKEVEPSETDCYTCAYPDLAASHNRRKPNEQKIEGQPQACKHVCFRMSCLAKCLEAFSFQRHWLFHICY